MHATTMIFLAIMPLGAAFFNFIIPLQIGACDVAFPRLNAFSYWVFGSTFFTLTGFHGTHVAIGVFWLASLVTHSVRGRLHQRHALLVEIAGLYWHFVDIVWIPSFTLVYLIPD